MSIQSWLDEFYPVAAKDVPDNNVAMLEHAVKKWEGLLPENLAKHDVFTKNGRLSSKHWRQVSVFIDGGTCSLCFRHSSDETCQACPLVQLNRRRCDMAGQPYRVFLVKNDPRPMLDDLRKALGMAKAEAKGESQ